MNPSRRKFLQVTIGASALATVPRIARAQGYPSRPVRIIVPIAAGGGADIVARLIGQSLAERLGQPFIIENRPGASGNIAAETVVRATADGYTLLVAASANAYNASLYDNLDFNFIRDIAPVAGLTRDPQVLEVHPALPVTTVPEFIAYAKANPDKLNMGSSGVGSPQHVAGQLFMAMTGVQLRNVSYRGAAPALTDLLAGRIQVMFELTTSSIEHVRAGKLRALAVTSATRLAVLPDLPTVAEFVPGYEAGNFRGIGAPRNTPVEIVDTLNKAINAALVEPAIQARIADFGGTALIMTPAEFGKLIADETAKWAKIFQAAGIKAE